MDPKIKEEIDNILKGISKNGRRNAESIKLSINHKIYKMFPRISENEKTIIKKYIEDEIKSNKNINISAIKNVKNEIILEEFKYKKTTLYLDSFNNIWNEECDIIGVKSKSTCYFFNV